MDHFAGSFSDECRFCFRGEVASGEWIALQLDLTIDKGLLYATLDELRGIVLDYSPGRVIVFTPVFMYRCGICTS